MTHSATSPTLGWQQVYAKGKQPRALRVTNQAGKGSGGRVVMKGKGTNPAAELQLAQSLSRAATAIRRAETAVETFGNGSEGAEAAYEEAADAVTSFLEADAALHPPSGASSSSTAPASSSSAAAAVGKGAASLGLSAYRDFVANKGKGKGKMCRAQPDAAAENEERSDCEEDRENENYEEEIEEEAEHGDDEDYVEVELEAIREEDHEGHAADGPDSETEDQEDAGRDVDGPVSHGLENEEENHGHEEGEPDYNEEEEFNPEEHS